MTTEEDFQKQLDDNPENYFLRTVFADWLQERNDPRAEGYRAMGILHKHGSDGNVRNKLHYWLPSSPTCWFREGDKPEITMHYCELPGDWFDNLTNQSVHSPNWTEDYQNRREAEDALARAFFNLPPERKVELLQPKEQLV